MTEPKILVAQIGARRHYAIPSILHSRNWLDRFYTDLHSGSWPIRMMSAVPVINRLGPIRRALSRQISDIPHQIIRDFPLFGTKRMLRAGKTRSSADRYASYITANTAFTNLVCKEGFDQVNAVYVFNGAGLEIMKAAKLLGLKTIVEQTAADQAFEESLLTEERIRWPHWEQADVSPEDWRELSERESAERELADLVVCGSDYVRNSIKQVGGATGNCAVVPYGFKSVNSEPRARRSDSTFNVLFAGTLCLRKGIQYLVEAAPEFKKASINVRVVGPNAVSESAFNSIRDRLDYRGVIPRAEMSQHYDWADAFVLPTLSEGSANVCYESLAAGLPVITTPHAGSVVRDGTDGFIVPIRSSEQLVAKALQLKQDKTLWHSMSENATQRAQEFTWDHYASRLLRAVESIFEQPTVPDPARSAAS